MGTMKTTNKKAAAILDILTHGLDIGEGRKVDNTEGAFMAVSVNRLSENVFAVSHYFEQNGDLVPDPDMTFFRAHTGAWVPASYQDQFRYQEALIFEDGQISKFSPRLLSQLSSFANMWMNNIRDQQGGTRELRKACK
jgi:hypothetical protein